MTKKYCESSWLRSSVKLLAIGVALIALAACEQGEPTNAEEEAVATIEGSVVYRERMALPPTAEVEIELQDISRADAPAATLTTVTLPSRGGPPYQFSMTYKPSEIDERRRYALRATISVDGTLMFSNTDYIDPFGGNPVEVLVRRVPGGNGGTDEAAQPALENTRWVLKTLAGEPAQSGAGDKPLDISLGVDEEGDQPRVAGFSGCNRFTGSFKREGNSMQGSPLSFGPLAGTMMACAEGGELERAYLDMLGKVDSFRLQDGGLSLLTGGEVVATFATAP